MELEQRLYEALGVEPESGAAVAGQEGGSNGQTEQTAAEGGKEQEITEPVKEETQQEAENPADPHKAGEEQPKQVPVQQSEKERRENAARRRRAEQQAAIDEAVTKARREEQARSKEIMDSFFQQANLTNTMTGQPITSMEEFRAWKQAYDAAQLEKDLKAGKLTPEGLEQAISNHPVIKQAQEIVKDSKARQDEQAMEAARVRAQEDLREIQKVDPTIREIKDLLTMPNAKEFYGYVKLGLSFKDAYYLVNRESLEERKAEAAKQQAMNNSRSKDHLSATGAGARGNGAASVPAAEMAMYRKFNPDATEAEIQAHYNKMKKR